jgi:RNA polymerase sigma factor (TIGR02999 family)
VPEDSKQDGSTEQDDPVTGLLQQWRAGDNLALERLTPIVYAELRRRAQSAFRGEREGHTLQPTALVNELFGRLVPADIDWRDRSHFFALCSRMMRHILVDHAKARSAAKRGNAPIMVELDDNLPEEGPSHEDLLALNEALEKLTSLDARKSELLDLQLFGGLSLREIEAVTGLSSSTLDRELRFAKAWLRAELSVGSFASE